MLELSYITAILLTIFCLGLIDYRFKLCWFAYRQRAFRAIAIAWLGLIIWDILGIWQGIFFSGSSKYTTGIYVAPELPIEEFFLLIVIVYTPLLIWTFLRGKRHV
jgi:lycopene cyclase domain-containing protein